jgi:hypothetical protein
MIFFLEPKKKINENYSQEPVMMGLRFTERRSRKTELM